MEYTKDEFNSLMNFLRTYPDKQLILKLMYENPDSSYTVDSFNQSFGTKVSFLDLKSLVIYRVLNCLDEKGQLIANPFLMRETNLFRLNPEKRELAEVCLRRLKKI